MVRKIGLGYLVTISVVALVLMSAVGCGNGARDQDNSTKLNDLPTAAKDSIMKLAGDNKITEVEVISSGSVKAYAAEWKLEGKEVEVLVDATGKLLRRSTEMMEKEDTEEEENGNNSAEEAENNEESGEEEGEESELYVEPIKFDAVPAAVKRTLSQETGSNASFDVETYWGDETQLFEIEIIDNEAAESKLIIDINGKIVNRLEIHKSTLNAVPATVKEAALEILDKSDISEVEEVGSNGEMFYDIEFTQGTSEITVRFDSCGKVLARFIERSDSDDKDDEKP